MRTMPTPDGGYKPPSGSVKTGDGDGDEPKRYGQNKQTMKRGPIKKKGSFKGKSNALGHGGRAAQMKAQGVPDAVIGIIARREGAAPGGPNYHGKRGG